LCVYKGSGRNSRQSLLFLPLPFKKLKAFCFKVLKVAREKLKKQHTKSAVSSPDRETADKV
jgi:hypothetical protein